MVDGACQLNRDRSEINVKIQTNISNSFIIYRSSSHIQTKSRFDIFSTYRKGTLMRKFHSFLLLLLVKKRIRDSKKKKKKKPKKHKSNLEMLEAQHGLHQYITAEDVRHMVAGQQNFQECNFLCTFFSQIDHFQPSIRKHS